MKRPEYNFIVLIALLSVCSFACSKEDDDLTSDAGAFMTAKIGGRMTDFGYGLRALRKNDYTLTVLGHHGEFEQGKESENLQLVIFDSAERITAQT